jgi:hypothetical protein
LVGVIYEWEGGGCCLLRGILIRAGPYSVYLPGQSRRLLGCAGVDRVGGTTVNGWAAGGKAARTDSTTATDFCGNNEAAG